LVLLKVDDDRDLTNNEFPIIIYGMTEEKGLTGIREDARGFVGSYPQPKVDYTKSNRARIKFSIACGRSDKGNGKYPTWRFCVAYSEIAESLRTLRVGNLVRVSGWVSTEWQIDEYYKPVVDERGVIQTKEFLIVYKAEVVEYQKEPELQPELLRV